MGLSMGIFNLFIVIPQLLGATLLGPLLDLCFHGRPIWAMAIAGASMFVAGLCTLRLHSPSSAAGLAQRARPPG